jgi:hypothetical protein
MMRSADPGITPTTNPIKQVGEQLSIFASEAKRLQIVDFISTNVIFILFFFGLFWCETLLGETCDPHHNIYARGLAKTKPRVCQ